MIVASKLSSVRIETSVLQQVGSWFYIDLGDNAPRGIALTAMRAMRVGLILGICMVEIESYLNLASSKQDGSYFMRYQLRTPFLVLFQ